MSDLEDVFGLVISSYSSQQAVEDGVLVAVTRQDAVTRSVWEFFVSNTPMGPKPPNCWPVEMMGWFRAGSISKTEALKMIAKHGKDAQTKYEEKIRHDKALAMSKGLIGNYSRLAIQAEDRGDILEIHMEVSSDCILGIVEQSQPGAAFTRQTMTMYLRPNELGGVTLMFPEDN